MTKNQGGSAVPRSDLIAVVDLVTSGFSTGELIAAMLGSGVDMCIKIDETNTTATCLRGTAMVGIEAGQEARNRAPKSVHRTRRLGTLPGEIESTTGRLLISSTAITRDFHVPSTAKMSLVLGAFRRIVRLSSGNPITSIVVSMGIQSTTYFWKEEYEEAQPRYIFVPNGKPMFLVRPQ